jgi:hypothetical protein
VDKIKRKALEEVQDCLVKKSIVSRIGHPLTKRITVGQMYKIDLEENVL